MNLFFSKGKKSITLNCKKIKVDNYAFSDKIEDVVFNSKVKIILSSAFLGCRNLKSVKFSEGIVEIGENAFSNCSSLTEIKLPQTLKFLGEYVFKDCINLTEITLPDSIEYLPKGAFRNCTSLKSVVLPKKLKVIGEECFEGCINLEKVVFPDEVLKVEKKAFKRCSHLQTITFPESIKYIGDFAFDSCNNLDYVKFDGTLEFLGKKPFPKHCYNDFQVSETAFVSSFLVDGDEGTCPVVNIPDNIKFLSLGFAGVLSDFGAGKDKTCFNHILSINKQTVRIFIGEKYYSYNDDSDYLIENSKFNFSKYDAQFCRASDKEKAFIAIYRLVYCYSLSEEYKKIYKDALLGNERDVAVFAVSRNDISILSYLVENSSLGNDFYTSLYNIALENGNRKMLDIISINCKKTGITETENLFGDLLNN